MARKTDLIELAQQRRDMAALEKRLLRGVCNEADLAYIFHVTEEVIHERIQIIKRNWRHNLGKSSKGERARRIRQLDLIIETAWASFERSRQDEEEVSTTSRNCPDCNGSGEDENTQCPTCEGTGKQTVETRKIRGQAGDPAFLRVVKEAVVEITKLQGLYPRQQGSKLQAVIGKLNDDGTMRAMISTVYADAPADQIIRALAVLDEIRTDKPALVTTGKRVERKQPRED